MNKNYYLFRFRIIVFIVAFFFCSDVFSANIYVNDGSALNDVYCSAFGNDANSGLTAGSPKLTLAAAYAIATSGDIIYVDSGTYISTGTIAFNKNNIQIIGAGAANTIFESGSVTGTVRWGNLTANNAVFKGIQITKYDCASDGIAMTISSGTGIIFDQVIIYANVGSGGQGSLYISGSTTSVTIKNSSLPCNRVASANYGGALKINNATVNIENCSMNNNVISALDGGAILIQGASANVTITNSTFDANGATTGGAIAHKGGTLTILNSCFDSNITAGGGSAFGGGAIIINPSVDSNVTISNCSFSNNSTTAASSDGGAITITNLNDVTSNINIKSCSFTNNNAVDKGEDISFDKGSTAPVFDVVLENNTFNSVYSGTQVNLYNKDIPKNSIKINDLGAGIGGNGDMVADGLGVSVSKPEFGADTTIVAAPGYTENSTALPSSLPLTICNDRFTGTCGAASATFICSTLNTWGDVTTTATDADVITFDKGANLPNAIAAATWATSVITFTKATHGLVVGNWVVIEGFTPAGYNGYYKVTAVPTTGTFRVAKTTNPGTTTVLGTFTKGTPIGWSRKTIPTVDEHVIIDYDYNTSTYGNIDACVMTVKTGKTLVIDNDSKLNAGVDELGTYVYVVNSIFNNGIINVKSRGNLVQVNYPLDLNNESIVTPNINFTKDTGNKIRWDYVYWSKPVSNAILPVFNTNFDIKYYWDPDFCVNGVNFSYQGWRSLVSEPTVATGFITRVKTSVGTTPANITLNYSGTSNNGNYNATVKYYDNEHNAFRNFTLLGNPYPGAIKFEDFYNENSDKIYGTVYLWSANTPYPGSGLYQQADYASFNLTGGVGVPSATTQSPNGILPNGYIASAQGFMVRPKVNGTVLFTNKQRTKDIPSNNQFYRGANEEKDRYWLRLADAEGRYNELLVGYISGATNDFDEAYDGPINSLSPVKFYSVLGDEKLVIQGREAFQLTDKVALDYSLQNPSSMLTISLSKKEGVFNTQSIYLHDKKMNFYHDLTQASYFFYPDNTVDRFEIVYQSDRVDEDILNEETEIQASILNSQLGILSNAPISKVELYDINGRLIFNASLEQNVLNYTKNIVLASGIYIVNVTCVNGAKKTTKILNQN